MDFKDHFVVHGNQQDSVLPQELNVHQQIQQVDGAPVKDLIQLPHNVYQTNNLSVFQ